MKRIFLLVATNLAVMLVLSIVVQVFGLDRVPRRSRALNLQALLVFSAVFGFGGAFISLLISKWMAKRAMGVQVITQPANEAEQLAGRTPCASRPRRPASACPKSASSIRRIRTPSPPARSKNAALVAVSTGLLRNMRRDEVEAVLGHEVSHVANGDMVTLTLIQGVVNTFVIFLARVIGGIVDTRHARQERERGPGIGYFVTVIVAQIVLGILASMIVAWFSRQREFRADAGGAHLAGHATR